MKKLIGILAIVACVVFPRYVAANNGPNDIKSATKKTRVDNGDWVQTQVKVCPKTGKVHYHTTTETHHFLDGFRSGMYFALEDGAGNILYTSREITSGVNARGWFGSSKRTKHGEFKVDSAKLAEAKRIVIRHYEQGKLWPGVGEAKTMLEDAKKLVKEGKEIYDLIPKG